MFSSRQYHSSLQSALDDRYRFEACQDLGAFSDWSSDEEDDSAATDCPNCQQRSYPIDETEGVIREGVRNMCLDCIYAEDDAKAATVAKQTSCDLCSKVIEDDEPEVEASLHLCPKTRTIDRERKASTLTTATLCCRCYETCQDDVLKVLNTCS